MYQAQPRKNPFVTIIISLLIAGVFFVFGYFTHVAYSAFVPKLNTFGDNRLSSQGTDQDTDQVAVDENLNFELFWQVWSLLKTDFVTQPIDDQTLFYGAIQGIAGAVDDPYTVFLDPKLTARFESDINGAFEGIGAEIGMQDSQLVVIAPLKGSPAEQAGLITNDAIIKIDGQDTIGFTIDEAVDKIRGPKSSEVVLTIYRSGAEDFQDISIIRDVIEIPVLESRVEEHDGKKIGIIELSHFNTNSSTEFIQAANDLLRSDVDGIILDLRNNPGGLLSESVTIASQFIEDGIIVNEKFNDGREESYEAEGAALFVNEPKLVVLINGGSASASEIVAGAIQDHQRGNIIGTQSYGKGSVQDYRSFDDGSSLKMTVAEWLTPNGNTINGQGITPDIEVELTVEDREAEQDPQFDRAVEELLKS